MNIALYQKIGKKLADSYYLCRAVGKTAIKSLSLQKCII